MFAYFVPCGGAGSRLVCSTVSLPLFAAADEGMRCRWVLAHAWVVGRAEIGLAWLRPVAAAAVGTPRGPGLHAVSLSLLAE